MNDISLLLLLRQTSATYLKSSLQVRLLLSFLFLLLRASLGASATPCHKHSIARVVLIVQGRRAASLWGVPGSPTAWSGVSP